MLICNVNFSFLCLNLGHKLKVNFFELLKINK
jgi:hypothetical protein